MKKLVLYCSIKNQSGLTIVELLTAFFVITISISAVIITNFMALKSQGNSKDIMIATNLAREGIEAVRTVRDTNWLYYSGSKRSIDADGARDHWNDGFDGTDHFGNNYKNINASDGCVSGDGDCSDVEVTHYFIPEMDIYSAIDDNRYQWKLRHIEQTQNPILLDNEMRDYIMLSDSEEYILYEDENTSLLIQNATYDSETSGIKKTNFRRLIEITFKESYDDALPCAPLAPATCKLNANDNIIDVRSMVVWLDSSGDARNVVLKSQISDWFRRDGKE